MEAFINPKITWVSEEETPMAEGCLSLPGKAVNVTRPSSVEMEYYDENFIKRKEKFTGLVAKIVQHEYDHLRGILIIDKNNGITTL